MLYKGTGLIFTLERSENVCVCATTVYMSTNTHTHTPIRIIISYGSKDRVGVLTSLPVGVNDRKSLWVKLTSLRILAAYCTAFLKSALVCHGISHYLNV